MSTQSFPIIPSPIFSPGGVNRNKTGGPHRFLQNLSVEGPPEFGYASPEFPSTRQPVPKMVTVTFAYGFGVQVDDISSHMKKQHSS